MTFHRYGRRFFEIPHVAVCLLIATNIFAYSMCSYFAGTLAIPSEMLFRSGAMCSAAIDRHEYWRLASYGFLHANLLQLATGMFCLALWGGHLERRIGAFYFIVVYICALISSAIVGIVTLPPQHLMVGASGAISGIMGALLCLWILGRIDVPANFFVINIGLNVALIALNTSNIGWSSQLGGFTAGVISCALLDLLERTNTLFFRCKFPEFVKLNGFVVFIGVAALFWGGKPIAVSFGPEGWPLLITFAIGSFCVIKLIDFILSMKKGLATIVIAFSAANSALLLYAGVTHPIDISAICSSRNFSAMIQKNLLNLACTNINLTIYVFAACVFVLTIVVYFHALFRGITDVGFVGATLRAERKRREGI